MVQPDTVVVIGTEHAGRARGVAVWPGGAWGHPLGDMVVDSALARKIVELGPPFIADEQAHGAEHSVEVQLPFLARTCPATRLVPMIVNTRVRNDAQWAGEALGRLLSETAASQRVVIAASSDLAHYPRLEVARGVDELMLRAICRLDAAQVLEDEEAACATPHERLGCGLCGREATRIAIAAARGMGADRGVLLEHATSVDYGHGDPARTVGYASVAFTA
jgi:AmmeMemoRadiSam system protein B